MYRDYKQTFSYEAKGDFGFSRDISLQEFMRGTKDLLSIIGHHYENIDNSPESKGVITFGRKRYTFKNLEQETSAETIFDFFGEVPFHTHHARGCVRTGIAQTHIERYAAQTAVGLLLGIIPGVFVLTRDMDPLWTFTGLLPNLFIAVPGLYELSREEKRKEIKTLELEFHVLEKRSTHTGQVENVLKLLHDYRINAQKP